MTHDALPVRGSPGSPYTRKMLAVLRYRHIPYRFLQSAAQVADLPSPKVRLIPILYFPDGEGGMTAEVDSTPLIRRLEDEYSGRSVIPADPALAFLNDLFEDYGDEWLTKAMFHYRWHHAADTRMAGAVLPHYDDVTRSDDEIAAMSRMFTDRQVGRLYVVGSNNTTAPVIEASYRRFLALFDAHLQRHPFLLGERPASADFAVFGQLTQLAQFDPTPASLTARDWPRVHAWVSKVEDLSGVEADDGGFLDPSDLPETLTALFAEIGRTYVPVLKANAQALDAGRELAETTVDGQPWEQQPFPYQGKCLQQLRVAHARLDGADRERVDAVLAGTGCEALFRRADA